MPPAGRWSRPVLRTTARRADADTGSRWSLTSSDLFRPVAALPSRVNTSRTPWCSHGPMRVAGQVPCRDSRRSNGDELVKQASSLRPLLAGCRRSCFRPEEIMVYVWPPNCSQSLRSASKALRVGTTGLETRVVTVIAMLGGGRRKLAK